MRTYCFIFTLLLPLLAPSQGFSGESALSVGYGFAALNKQKHIGMIQGGKQYDFFQLGYSYETALFNRTLVVAEPFAAYINRPNDGADVGLNAGLKFQLIKGAESNLYVTAGTGVAYTSIGFEEQGTHFLFILQAGLGVRYKSFFIENRFRHYSNSKTAYPNRSVHADIITVGYYF